MASVSDNSSQRQRMIVTKSNRADSVGWSFPIFSWFDFFLIMLMILNTRCQGASMPFVFLLGWHTCARMTPRLMAASASHSLYEDENTITPTLLMARKKKPPEWGNLCGYAVLFVRLSQKKRDFPLCTSLSMLAMPVQRQVSGYT